MSITTHPVQLLVCRLDSLPYFKCVAFFVCTPQCPTPVSHHSLPSSRCLLQASTGVLGPPCCCEWQVVDALVSGGKGREDSAALVRKYAAAAARMRQDRKQRELDRRAEIEAHEAEVKRLAEEAARAQAAERARLLALQAQAQAQLELLRSRRPVVHCFGGCNRTAFFWSPCTVAPRQVGWVDDSGRRYPM
jgi:hypothetical protein